MQRNGPHTISASKTSRMAGQRLLFMRSPFLCPEEEQGLQRRLCRSYTLLKPVVGTSSPGGCTRPRDDTLPPHRVTRTVVLPLLGGTPHCCLAQQWTCEPRELHVCPGLLSAYWSPHVQAVWHPGVHVEGGLSICTGGRCPGGLSTCSPALSTSTIQLIIYNI